MRDSMPEVALSYFSYPKTQKSEVHFQSWSCPVCKGENPKSNGGTVAHEPFDEGNVHIDGRKHPIHLFCLLSLQGHTLLCPDCTAKTDATQVIPLATKCVLAAKRFFRALPDYFSDPMNQVYAGVLCMMMGAIQRKSSLLSLGMALQARVIDQAIRRGSSHIKLAGEIEQLVKEVLAKQGPLSAKLEHLKSIIAMYPKPLPNIDSDEGLRNTLEVVKRTIFGDRFVRVWRFSAALGALYYGRQLLILP